MKKPVIRLCNSFTPNWRIAVILKNPKNTHKDLGWKGMKPEFIKEVFALSDTGEYFTFSKDNPPIIRSFNAMLKIALK